MLKAELVAPVSPVLEAVMVYCVVNASRVAAPTVTLNAELASPGEAAG
jgi:hypothetical protein